MKGNLRLDAWIGGYGLWVGQDGYMTGGGSSSTTYSGKDQIIRRMTNIDDRDGCYRTLQNFVTNIQKDLVDRIFMKGYAQYRIRWSKCIQDLQDSIYRILTWVVSQSFHARP